MARGTIISRKRHDGITILAVVTLLSLGVAARAQLPALPMGADGKTDPAAEPREAEARAKLKQARALLVQGEFDSAERMAREAGLMANIFTKREDTPARVLEDVSKARLDPHALLAGSRTALKRNDLDRAEKLAQAAEQHASMLTFPLWSDSPSKVKKDIQAARAREAKTAKLSETKPSAKDKDEKEKPSGGFFAPVKSLFGSSKTTTKPEKTTTTTADTKKTNATASETQVGFHQTETVKETDKPVSSSSDTEQARRLLIQGRQALTKGQLDAATGFAEQARALKPALAWNEDNPERLLRAIQDIRSRTVASKPAMPVKTVARTSEREKTAVNDEDAAPAQSQQECSTLLREGRQQLKQGKFDEVRIILKRVRGYREAKYGLFDDSPDKLQNDLAKTRVKKDREASVHVLAEARTAYDEGEYDKASKLAFQAQQMHGPYNLWDLGDRPSKLIDEIQVAKDKKRNGSAVASRKDKKRTESKPDKVASKKMPQPKDEEIEKARNMLVEVGTLQMQGKLLEAKKKLAEVEALKVAFKADEMSPALMQQQLSAAAMHQGDVLAQSAVNLAAFGEGAPMQNVQTAEQMLKSARELLTAFNLDPTSIDQKSNYVAQTKARLLAPVAQVATGPGAPPAVTPDAPPAVGAGVPVLVPPTVASGSPLDLDARKHGLELLEQSRLELRKGNLSMARRQAEEAYQGDFGVKQLAEQRLRELDIEAHNQQRLGDRRNFDAAAAAFNRRDYSMSREILAGIHAHHLDEPRQARLRELMASPEMGGSQFLPGTSLADVTPGAGITTVTDHGEGSKAPALLANDPAAGRASASDNFEDDLLKKYKQMQNIQFQALRADAMKAMREAGDRAGQGDTEGAVTILQDFIAKLPESQLDSEKMAMLRKPVDSRIQKFQLLMEQSSIDRQVASKTKNPASMQTAHILADQNKQKNVAQLMKQFTAYYKDAKYKEAEMYAKMVVELDPDNPFATAAVTIARTQARRTEDKARKDGNELVNYKGMQDASKLGPWADIDNPEVFNKDRTAIGRRRTDPSLRDIGSHKTQAVREIESRMDLPVTVNFNNVPLHAVIEELRSLHNINIIADTSSLKEESISLDRPVTLQLDKVALKSALNIILRSVDLTWVIRDDVLQVTTKKNANGRTVQRTYLVADLVIPIEDHKTPEVFDWPSQVKRLNEVNAPMRNGNATTPTPTPGPMSLQGGSPVGSPFGSSSSSQGSGSGSGQGNNNNQTGQDMSRSGPASAMPQQLINLLTSSVGMGSWQADSGPGTIEYFPLGMTLVINQTPDIQEQIADLLQQLRRLQDLEVAIEIRLISLSDNFFERMGVNFDVNILTDKYNRSTQPSLLSGLQTGAFQPAGFVQAFEPSRFISGLTPAGTFTSDLNIPINASSFGLATPPFGLGSAFTGNTTGGLAFGLAFLSDIQVKFFMEAAQGDQRFNVMQSPKLMMFNGQSASLDSGYSQTFVSGVQIAAQGVAGGPLFIPNATVQNFGTAINVQPVVTGDRRFVRVNVALTLTNPIAQVPVFPIVVTVQPFIEGVGSVGNPSILTQFIQQPAVDFITVNTTAVVPDGGTVLLGGLKRLSEGRNEFGPPILSKIPYLNRLVKNVGYGRETENILMMITPRIVINEEEEIIQTGVISNPALVQQ